MDELRDAKRIARRDLAGDSRPRKADIARIVALLLWDAAVPHGDGFVTWPSGFGGVEWFFRCGGFGGLAAHLYRPPGAESFACRRWWGLAESRPDRGYSRFGRVQALDTEILAYHGRPGRRPRRYRRALLELETSVQAGIRLLRGAPESLPVAG